MKIYALSRITLRILKIIVFGQISKHDECFYMAAPATEVQK